MPVLRGVLMKAIEISGQYNGGTGALGVCHNARRGTWRPNGQGTSVSNGIRGVSNNYFDFIKETGSSCASGAFGYKTLVDNYDPAA